MADKPILTKKINEDVDVDTILHEGGILAKVYLGVQGKQPRNSQKSHGQDGIRQPHKGKPHPRPRSPNVRHTQREKRLLLRRRRSQHNSRRLQKLPQHNHALRPIGGGDNGTFRGSM